MLSGNRSDAGRSAPPPAMQREVLDSPSRHVQLALALVPGPSLALEPQPYLRLIFNIGPNYVIDATGPRGRHLFQCRRHSLLVIPPDTAVEHHAALPKPAGRAYVPARMASFRISRELLADCAIALALPPRLARPEHQVIAPDEVLRGLATALLADLRSGGVHGAAGLEATARALVCHVLLRHQKTGPSATADAIARVQAHIDAQLNAPLALEELAGVAGMSVFHFCRVFRDKLGATPHQYILARRIARAKRLLWEREAGASVVDVALACGFASSSHFAAQFKRATGQTPLQWRRGAASPD